MRVIGVDIGAEAHAVAMVDEAGRTLLKPTSIPEDASGGRPAPRPARGAHRRPGRHGGPRALLAEPLRHPGGARLRHRPGEPLAAPRFAQEAWRRTTTDAIDALGLAHFGRQQRPQPTPLPDRALEELRELVHLRDRLVQDLGDRVRQLHRLVDLGFPEFTRPVADLGSALATTILREYPTARAFRGVPVRRLAHWRYDGRHRVGEEVAQALTAAAATSVGQHHGEPYRLQIRDACEDLDLWRGRLRTVERDIERLLGAHHVGQLLPTIPGIGPQTAARLLARVGDPADFCSAGALAALVGAVPGLRQSGTRQGHRASLHPSGTATCEPSSGCRRSAPSAATPGCGRTTCVCSPAASCPRSPWSRRCARS